MISAPANLICVVFSSHLAAKKPFTFLVYVSIFRIFAHSYSIFVLLGTFPNDPALHTDMHVYHVALIQLVTDLADNVWFVAVCAIFCVIVDKRIAGIHITLFASMTNMAQFAHKSYIYTLVDTLGIFIPQAVIAALSLSITLAMAGPVC